MRLRVDKGATPGNVIQLTDLVFTIGRELDNRYIINEGGVSRHHCTIQKEGDDWYVEDRNSSNGVLVNDLRIEGKQLLQIGDKITVYNHEFVFLDDEEKEPEFASLDNDLHLARKEKTHLPWGKIIFLLIILLAIAFLTKEVFFKSTDGDEVTLDNIEEMADVDVIAPVPVKTLETEHSAPGAGTETQDAPLRTNLFADNTQAETQNEQAYLAPENAVAQNKTAIIETNPPGAELYINGELQDSLTPLILSDLKPGRYSLELRKNGYENNLQRISVPDDLPLRTLTLRQKAATLFLETEPSAAHVWLERRFLGVTPLLIDSLEVGKHELTIRGPGCETKKVNAEISFYRGEKLMVELQSNLGNLELITQPGNCKVYLQNVYMGTTKAAEGSSKSELFKLTNIIAGEQRLKIEHSSGVSASGRIVIPREGTLQRSLQLKLPTHRLSLKSGEVYYGILLEQNAQGDVVLEDMNKRAERFLNPQINECRLMTDAEIAEALADGKKAAGKEQSAYGNQSNLLSVADLRRAMMNMPPEDFNKANAGKTYYLSGKPTMVLQEAKGIVSLMFTTNIKCQFNNLSKAEQDEISAADKGNIAFQGVCVGIGSDGVMLLRNCQLLSEF